LKLQQQKEEKISNYHSCPEIGFGTWVGKLPQKQYGLKVDKTLKTVSNEKK